MKKIVVSVSTGYIGSRKEKVIEVEDDSTEEEIQEIAESALWEMIDFDWYEKDNG
ncbi:MAG TPA: hypothetical protein VFM18_22425 [Methanosarcina sp.]|nr:hypothetical protein [Methanosarcina sp.]